VRVVATARDVRITSRKARVVAESIVGLPVAEALTLLNFTPRHGAREVAKVIKSAVANAEHNYNLETSSLRVDRLEVEPAGIIKRYIAKPRGMAGSVFKRMSHLRCYVTDEEPEPNRRRRSLIAMPGRPARPSTRPAATRRRRPAQVRRAQEAAAAAAQAEAAPAAEAEAALPAAEVESAWGEGAGTGAEAGFAGQTEEEAEDEAGEGEEDELGDLADAEDGEAGELGDDEDDEYGDDGEIEDEDQD